jgi:beta-lactamase class C
MAEHRVPGMAIAVTTAGRPAFFNYGVASKADGSPVSEETLFEIAACSGI